MTAYLVCHFEARKGSEGKGCREILAQRIAELWTGTLQLDGNWIVQADVTSSDHIRDELMSMISDGDSLLVIGAGKDAAWAGFQEADADWLVENI